MDLHTSQPLKHWTITFTSQVGFSDAQEDQIVQWHKRKAEMALLVRELHEDGSRHYHSLIAVKTPTQAVGVSRLLETLYKQMDLVLVKGVSVRVKCMTDKIGFFHYLLKDLDGQDPLLCMGWRLSWIKEQCLANLKKIPHKMLCKDAVQLTKRTSTRMVMAYAKRSGMRITGKFSFADVIASMMKDAYQFENTNMKYLYAQVMAQSGNTSAARDLILGELRFLED